MTWRGCVGVFLLIAACGLMAPRTVAAGTSWEALKVHYEREVSQHPTSVEGRFRLAVVYAHEGRLVDGWQQLKRLDQLIGGEPARTLAARRFIEEAQASLRQDPRDVFALSRLAMAAYFAGRKNLALEAMRRAAALEPKHSWTLGYVGFLYGERQDVDQAIAWWQRGVRADPRNAVLHYLLGLAYSRKGDMKRAGYHFVLAYRDRTLYEYIKGQRNL
ncbi:MAG: tetratricopeptide repeat protein [Armatimonadota bacterium]|nr:tetratricopeptide repeat protein [Armatimonadota bacterium]MDR7458590.1 tetratricopeptide repeat protein [Armatimonadota bacterium]MDR7479506.1 tetratricopeptide repeat protein [Armatimonadota bacterium]MDR7492527.1 tetratricopeptide repeat protein [Armatimonadota bacterium]MDR7526631.1 tetratricopeptide repeat protein [Armatimonadota bacterium]